VRRIDRLLISHIGVVVTACSFLRKSISHTDDDDKTETEMLKLKCSRKTALRSELVGMAVVWYFQARRENQYQRRRVPVDVTAPNEQKPAKTVQ
jgi:hypothetical protein